MDVINVTNLHKSYGKIRALKGISFNVPKGSIFGFLGPNGAGKSTTIALLLQFLKQDLGDIQIFGQDVNNEKNLIKVKKRIGFIPDADLPKIQAYRFLRHTGQYFGLRGIELRKEIIRVVKLVDAKEFINRNTARLSRGQKTRIKIANALLHDPELIIADEPTSGLDPISRNHFLGLIKHLTEKEEKTVFLSSHVIGEIEKVSTSIIILSKGRIVQQGSISDILKSLPASNKFVISCEGITSEELANLPGVEKVESHSPGRWAVSTKNDEENLTPAFLRELVSNPKVKINYFSRDNVNLENLFFEAVKGEKS